jgi:hypothetical protein
MAYTSLADLRKSRGGFDSLMKEVEKIANPQSDSKKSDDRFWQPEVDKAGNGYAVIRFLAPPQGEDLPFVRVWNHGFQGPTGKWYIENSLTTIGKQDPVSELNTELWNSGSEANKEVARKQKRKLTYYANILVVKDPSRPDNEGKVFLFKFGKKIWDKIKDMADPQFEDEKPVNVFDFDTGANFKLKIRNVEGYRNYDKSEFESPSPISNDDSIIEKIWSQQHSLTAFLDAKNFKSYDDLKKKLTMVLSAGVAPVKPAENVDLDEDIGSSPVQASAPRASVPTPKQDVNFDDDEESLSYFAKLASDD